MAAIWQVFSRRMSKESIAQHLDFYYSSPEFLAALIAGDKNVDYVPFDQRSGIPNLVDAAH